MLRFTFMMAVAVFGLMLASGDARAQDRCQTELVGNSYSCDFTSTSTPALISPVPLSFTAPVVAEVNTAFQMNYGGTIPLACACMPSGKPGKLKSSEKSGSFVCVEAQTSPIVNDMVLEGKVAGGGKKIVKGRLLFNGFGTDAAIFTCVQN